MKIYQQRNIEDMASDLAEISIKIGAFSFMPEHPVKWASGYWMPVQSNFGRLLFSYTYRTLVREFFDKIRAYNGIGEFDVVAGTSLSGASPATTLADLWQKPLIIVRSAKQNEAKKNIEGILESEDLDGRRVMLIEDRIETGRSSAKAVQTIRDANGKIDYCLTIFDYGFESAAKVFEGREPFDDGQRLSKSCKVYSALIYDNVLEAARNTNHVNDNQLLILDEWHKDPFGWGEKHGFPHSP